MNQSAEFLKAIQEVWERPLPDEVMARAKRSLLDYLAVTCAGAEFQKDKLNQYYAFSQPEAGKFRAIGTGKDLVMKEAVFLNGLNGHALDFDDGTNSGIIHLGSPIFSLLIPLSQRYGITVDEMLKAAVAGYEASYTMAVSIQPGHKAMGYHATGTCGTLGATIAASYMLGFTEEERFQAFACACVAASGMLKVLDDGSELKPYNVAKTALLALTALQLAKSGFKGHSDPLGGRGFLKMMTGKESVLYQVRNTVRGNNTAFQRERFRERTELFTPAFKFVQNSAMKGVVVGGNIRCFLKLAGTRYFPDLQGKVLLLESLGGEVPQMATYLAQLKQLGAFDKVNGVLLGTFTTMERNQCTPDIVSLVKEVCGPALPIATTLEIGHGDDSKAIIIGREFELRS